MTTSPSVFLDAQWRRLLMVNYEVDPQILLPYLPVGTQLDLWNDRCYLSLVGFMFLDTRVLGLKIPFHVDFEEVNLRFYVYREMDGERRRGVVFLKEIVPKIGLSLVANTVYGEHYETCQMYHDWEEREGYKYVEYGWKKDQWHAFSAKADLRSIPIAEGSEEEFITEHYWGYTRLSAKATSEYQVAHPRWEVYPVKEYSIDVDFEHVYGKEFAPLMVRRPVSVFLAEGSEIQVMKGAGIGR